MPLKFGMRSHPFDLSLVVVRSLQCTHGDDPPFELPDQEPGQKYLITPAVVRGEAPLFTKKDSAAA